MSANEDEALSLFISISQCPPDEAKRYLEMANWNVDMAAEIFFENGGSRAGEPVTATAVPPVPSGAGSSPASNQNMSGVQPTVPQQPPIASGGTGGYESDDEGAMQTAIEDSLRGSKQDTHHHHSGGASSSVSKKEDKKKAPPSKFGTISGLQKDDESSEEEGQAFYAGGSERSGQQIIGPPKPKENNDKKVGKLFEAAREQGAHEADMHECDDEDCGHGHGSAAGKKKTAFSGVGYSLGDETTPSRTVGAPTTAPGGAAGPKKPAAEQLPLRFYSDGFTVGDGELRKFDDPANKEFMDHIKRGEVPPELKNLATGGKQVEVRLEDHRGEEYKRVAPAFRAFTGSGQMLGTPTPNVVGAASTTATSASTGPTKSAMASSASSSSAPTNAQPTDVSRLAKAAEQRFGSSSSNATTTTSLRLRLPGATAPVSISLPQDRSLNDVRQLLSEAWAPLGNGANFEFMEPPATKIQREEEHKSLKDARLTNALLAVRKI